MGTTQGIDRQRGMALVAVLGVLAVAGVMIAHLAMLGAVIQRESVVASERSQLKYVAESAAGGAIWSYLVDRRLFTNRSLGQVDVARETSELETWMLDGRRHGGDEGTTVRVALTDAAAGIDLSGRDPGSDLRDRLDPDDEEENEIVQDFLGVAADYADANDLQRPVNGKERDDYESEGWVNFPRNGPLQFREEAYWLAGWREALHGRVRIIPPRGIRVRRGRRQKPSFFSSSPTLIQRVLRLDDGTLATVLSARQAWRQGLTPLADSLDADLLGRISASFTLSESGIATVEALAESHIAGISRRIRVTLNCDWRRTDAFSDRHRKALALWERRFF
ncbi:MAG: hypothetical protein HN849_26200 [Victivallales bacterium]|nr:hypothetical protein [Victivallales bacterium]MBT7303052.1 hypothetical protein [Victivallales bacterium]